MNLGPFAGRRRGRSDDSSILRGAAILRDHLLGGNSSRHWFGSDRSASQSSGWRDRENDSRGNSNFSEEEMSAFSDPWRIKVPSLKTKVRSDTPDTKGDDGSSFAFESSLGSSVCSQWECTHRVFGGDHEDYSLFTKDKRTPQPDTDPCDPLPRPRSNDKKSVLGGGRVKPSIDENDGNCSYGDRDWEDYKDQSADHQNYLPKEIRENLTRLASERRVGGRNASDKENRRSKILQRVVTNLENGNARLSRSEQRSLSLRSLDEHNRVHARDLDQTRGLYHSQVRQQMPTSYLRNVVSPLSVEYAMLMQDPAYQHAQKAGLVWQSLVGGQIRFPSSWFNGARSPSMSSDETPGQWQYYGRYPCYNPNLRLYVKHRSAPGRLLLHIVVKDLVTWKPVQDIVVGCFDPNSRGIRKTRQAEKGYEHCRELWLAVRKRSESFSVIDKLLAHDRSWKGSYSKSPLGPGQRITNSNVRAVFGEEPPAETIFVHESALYERLMAGKDQGPALFLVREFLFS